MTQPECTLAFKDPCQGYQELRQEVERLRTGLRAISMLPHPGMSFEDNVFTAKQIADAALSGAPFEYVHRLDIPIKS